jgi:hypothetical protein
VRSRCFRCPGIQALTELGGAGDLWVTNVVKLVSVTDITRQVLKPKDALASGSPCRSRVRCLLLSRITVPFFGVCGFMCFVLVKFSGPALDTEIRVR